MTSLDEGRCTALGSRSTGAGWKGTRRAALAALLAAGLMVASTTARAADQGTPSEPHAADPKQRVSPYARFAREHQQLVGRKSARGRPATLSVGHAPRLGGHTRR